MLELEKASELINEMDEEITTKTQLIEDFKVSFENELDKNKRLTSLINERMLTDILREQASFQGEENDFTRMTSDETDNLSKILSLENRQRSITLPKTGTGDTATNSKPLVNVGILADNKSQHGSITRNSNPIDSKKKEDSHGTQNMSEAIKVHDHQELDSNDSYSQASSWKPQFGNSKILNKQDFKNID